MLKSFKEFIIKGNMIDLAVGIIIGAAFKDVVNALVSKVIMPPIGLLLGGVDFSKLAIVLKPARLAADGTTIEAVTIGYGAFINSLIDLVIIGFAVFVIVRMYQRLQKKEEEAPEEEPKPSDEAVLLGEIRDLLQKQSAG